MFTDAQMEQYNEGLAFFSDKEIVPPRQFNVHDYPLFPNGDSPAFGDGQMLVLGFNDPDHETYNCGCGQSHVTYAGIRADGMIGPVITSNTYGEQIAATGIDPMLLMLGQLFGGEDSGEDSGDAIAPKWDDMDEVTPDQWPIGESAQPTVTDMADYEALLNEQDRRDDFGL